jgi:hypothetical protein
MTLPADRRVRRLQGRDDPFTGQPGRGSTPHGYAARHRTTHRQVPLGRSSQVTHSRIEVGARPVTATVAATATHTNAHHTQRSRAYTGSHPIGKSLSMSHIGSNRIPYAADNGVNRTEVEPCCLNMDQATQRRRVPREARGRGPRFECHSDHSLRVTFRLRVSIRTHAGTRLKRRRRYDQWRRTVVSRIAQDLRLTNLGFTTVSIVRDSKVHDLGVAPGAYVGHQPIPKIEIDTAC